MGTMISIVFVVKDLLAKNVNIRSTTVSKTHVKMVALVQTLLLDMNVNAVQDLMV
jgi:hypothetical protein